MSKQKVKSSSNFQLPSKNMNTSNRYSCSLISLSLQVCGGFVLFCSVFKGRLSVPKTLFTVFHMTNLAQDLFPLGQCLYHSESVTVGDFRSASRLLMKMLTNSNTYESAI